jgi:predicted GIY-YIG superfamily endonuclease
MYVYVLKSTKGALYVGQTSREPFVRLKEHIQGNTKSTRGRKWNFLYIIGGFTSTREVVAAEKAVKRLPRQKKENSCEVLHILHNKLKNKDLKFILNLKKS